MTDDHTPKTSESDTHDDTSYDLAELDRQATFGAKAYTELHKHAGDDWQRWEATIIGLAALRDLAFAKIGYRDMRTQQYRDAIGALMMRPRFAIYGQMRRQERSACYKMMDHIHEISAWYTSLPSSEKLSWKHPETIVKHCPEQFLTQDPSPKHNQPPQQLIRPKSKPKPQVSAETERLRALLIQVIKLLMKHEPETAQKLLDQVMPPDAPSDSLEDI